RRPGLDLLGRAVIEDLDVPEPIQPRPGRTIRAYGAPIQYDDLHVGLIPESLVRPLPASPASHSIRPGFARGSLLAAADPAAPGPLDQTSGRIEQYDQGRLIARGARIGTRLSMAHTSPATTPPAEKVKQFPTAPGLYLMKDAQGRVLYIGKAKN